MPSTESKPGERETEAGLPRIPSGGPGGGSWRGVCWCRCSSPGASPHPSSRGRRGIAAKAPYQMSLGVRSSNGPVVSWQNRFTLYIYIYRGFIYSKMCMYICVCVCVYLHTYYLHIFIKYIHGTAGTSSPGKGSGPGTLLVQEAFGRRSWLPGLTGRLPLCWVRGWPW